MKRWLAGLMAAIITINAVFIFAPLRSDAFVDEIIGEMFGYSYSNFMDALYGVVDVWTTDKPVQEKWLESEEIIHDNKALPLVPYAITSYMRNHSGDRSAGTNAPELPADIRGAEDTTPSVDIQGGLQVPENFCFNVGGTLVYRNVFYNGSLPDIGIPYFDFTLSNNTTRIPFFVQAPWNGQIDSPYTVEYIILAKYYFVNGRPRYGYFIRRRNGQMQFVNDYVINSPNFGTLYADLTGNVNIYNNNVVQSVSYLDLYNFYSAVGIDYLYNSETEVIEMINNFFGSGGDLNSDIVINGGDTYIEYSPKYITNYGDYAPDNSTYYLDYPDSTVENYFNFDNEVNMKNSLVNLIGVLAGALGVLAPVDVDMSLPDLVAKFNDLVGQLNLAFQTGDINANIDRLFDLYNRLDISPYVAIDIGDGDVYNPPDKIPVATGTPTLPPDVKFKLVDKDYLIEYSDDDETNITINIQLPTYEPKGTDFPVYYKYPLTRYFPFSIPYDIYTLLQLFVADPEAPSFDINVPTYLAANQDQVSEKLVQDNYTTIDLSRFDPVMEYVRPVLLIGAVIGLLLTIKKFMF